MRVNVTSSAAHTRNTRWSRKSLRGWSRKPKAARALTWRCAIQKDRGLVNNMRETVLAKYYASRAADEVPNLGLEVLSAYGYSNEYPIARILRDGKVYKILEGATNIMKMILATDALGLKKPIDKIRLSQVKEALAYESPAWVAPASCRSHQSGRQDAGAIIAC